MLSATTYVVKLRGINQFRVLATCDVCEKFGDYCVMPLGSNCGLSCILAAFETRVKVVLVC
jgi:hypothetical protein